MKNKISYFGLAAFVVLLVSNGCEKETNDFIISEAKETNENNSSNESQSSLSGMGIRLPDFSGEERKYAVSFSIGNKIFLGFGFNSSGPLKDMWVWNFDTGYTDWDLTTNNSWKKLPDFPGSFSKNGRTEGTPVGFAVNGKGYILPAVFWDVGNLVNEFWEFDPETNVWTQKADPPVTLARNSVSGFSIGTKLYIGTGETYFDDIWKLYNDFWEWDQTTDTWTKKADFPGAARAHTAGFSIGNKGYLGLGGEIGMGGGPFYQDFWEYDQTTDKWTNKADFKGTQLIDAVGFSVGNKGYLAAGWDPLSDSTATQEIWEWNQATDAWTKIGNFAGIPRTGAVGGSIGNWGYLLTGSNISKEWESLPMLSDFWLIDLTSD